MVQRIILFLVVSFLPLTVVAQHDPVDIPYQMPPDEVARIVDAAPAPDVSLSPDRATMLLLQRSGLPTIEELAQPELRLAGIRINPANNGPSRAASVIGLQLYSIEEDAYTDITGLPDGALIRNVSWSPDNQRIAFTVSKHHEIQLWVASISSGQASQIQGIEINDTFYGSPISWHPSGAMIFARTIPADRGQTPQPALAPSGPVIQQNIGRAAPARTFQDMLQDSHDEALFEHYFTSVISKINLENGEIQTISEPQIFWSLSPSPDGNLLMTSYVHRPFSYVVPASRFPTVTQVVDLEGNLVHTVAEIPLQDRIPIGFGATSEGRRSITWRNDADATLMWVEAQDGGNPRTDVAIRDHVMLQSYPFTDEPVLLAQLGTRYAGVMWGHDDLALIVERWFSTRNEKIWHVKPGSPDEEQRLLRDRNYEDIYNDPGSPQMRQNESGNAVLLTGGDGFTLYLTAVGASDDGNKPFLDRFNALTGETVRLWESSSPTYEFVVSVLDTEANEVITRRESITVPPNYLLLNLADGTERMLTDFDHPNPELIDVHREIIFYEREDGVPLSGTLLLPPGYDKERDGRLPLVVWAYPREFRSADAAGQRSDSPYRFNNIGYWGPQWLVTQGYAVLDNATMPVVGEGEKEPNDTFVQQLIMNSEAAIRAIADMGIADPDRAALGGHSYGAFMTANVLAHSDVFRAGIARSGAYNRSLTPFGFQREERTLWDDTDLYINMSPFFFANQINQPLLLIHGAEDNNSGTFPMQSERLFQAMQGLGGTVRLVMLPHESHGYRARESVMHMLWETLRWLDRYVKEAE